MNNKVKLCDTVKSGMRYGMLTVIEEDFEEEQRKVKNSSQRFKKYFKCQCDCGTYRTVRVYDLLSGNTKSCGKHRKGIPNEKRVINLEGKRFGSLFVLKKDLQKPVGGGKHAYWLCICNQCGTIKSIRGSDLTNGKVVDCGCGRSERLSNGTSRDLSNMKFGHLNVLEKDNTKIKSGSHSFWICKCDLCGRIESISSAMLTSYGKDRCKLCMGISNGEQKIIEILEENDILFVHDKPYNNFKYSDSKGTARFDFRINQESDCDYIIEFDGEQHFKKIPFYDNQTEFDQRVKHDLEKNKFCKDNLIPLIRIPYTKLKSLKLSDLIPDTTKYLVCQ